MKQWSKSFSECVQCGRSKFKHMAKGICSSCYAKNYKSDPVVKDRVGTQKKEWYLKYHSENLMKRRIDRESKHFSGLRDAVLVRDGRKCRKCSSVHQLVVHHKDGNGRGKSRPNNDITNLETLCRSCHLKVHHAELNEIRFYSKRKI